MKKYNHAIDMAFEFVTEDEDPITEKNLAAIVATARKRLDDIMKNNEIEAFGVFDTVDEVLDKYLASK